VEQEWPALLLKFGNHAANDGSTERCQEAGLKIHPARLRTALPKFLLQLLTQEGDIVLAPFAVSSTTGAVAERRQRRWLAVETVAEYLQGGRFRFE
jgi:site-specific DNA-methyltransferase (cytosine-N4-specific)